MHFGGDVHGHDLNPTGTPGQHLIGGIGARGPSEGRVSEISSRVSVVFIHSLGSATNALSCQDITCTIIALYKNNRDIFYVTIGATWDNFESEISVLLGSIA